MMKANICAALPMCAVVHVGLLVLLIDVSGSRLHAEEGGKGEQLDQKHVADETSRLAKLEVQKYGFFLTADDAKKLILQPKSILHWSNPTVGDVFGDVFVWTHRGRPEVIASYYRSVASLKQTVLEVKSLSREKLVARKDSQDVWYPEKAGVELKPIPGVPAPGDSALRRLSQMRSFVRGFKARVSDRRTDNRKPVNRDLRLLSRPVYRYDSSDPDILDGAIFAFVEGTDPEALLLIEAHHQGNEFRWHYAFARMNIDRLFGSYGGEQVWLVEELDPPWKKPRETYTLLLLEQN